VNVAVCFRFTAAKARRRGEAFFSVNVTVFFAFTDERLLQTRFRVDVSLGLLQRTDQTLLEAFFFVDVLVLPAEGFARDADSRQLQAPEYRNDDHEGEGGDDPPKTALVFTNRIQLLK